jgi:hypothetical protein
VVGSMPLPYENMSGVMGWERKCRRRCQLDKNECVQLYIQQPNTEPVAAGPPPPPVVRSVKRVGLRQRSRAQPSSTPVSAAALPSIDSVAAFLVHAPRSALANANPVPPRHTVTHTLVVVTPCFTSSQFMFL